MVFLYPRFPLPSQDLIRETSRNQHDPSAARHFGTKSHGARYRPVKRSVPVLPYTVEAKLVRMQERL
jgi:hypothetical protein